MNNSYLTQKNCFRLIADYMLFVQHNASQMIKNGRSLAQYGLVNYLVEELNYTPEESQDIKTSIQEFINDFKTSCLK